VTDRPDTAADDSVDDKSWKVEGSSDGPSDADGLGDTVVQISKIGANTSQPKPTMGRGGSSASRRRSSAKKPTQSTNSTTPKPSIPKPARPSPTVSEELMAPFDKAAAASAAEEGATKVTARAKTGAAPKPSPPSPSQSAASDPPTKVQPAVVAAAPAAAPAGAMPTMSEPARPASHAGPGVARRTRKARLRLSRIDPWSVMKTVFLFSIAFGIMAWVAVYVLWWVLQASGIFDVINESIVGIISSPNNTEGFRIEDYISANKVLGVTALLGVINVVITTALGTLGAFLYNLSANILGGLELTLAED
jgi:Transmembrane domain of unknown function (DUF3566)